MHMHSGILLTTLQLVAVPLGLGVLGSCCWGVDAEAAAASRSPDPPALLGNCTCSPSARRRYLGEFFLALPAGAAAGASPGPRPQQQDPEVILAFHPTDHVLLEARSTDRGASWSDWAVSAGSGPPRPPPPVRFFPVPTMLSRLACALHRCRRHRNVPVGAWRDVWRPPAQRAQRDRRDKSLNTARRRLRCRVPQATGLLLARGVPPWALARSSAPRLSIRPGP